MRKLKNVLITGWSGGFGNVIIEALLTQGYTITVTMRDAAGRNRQAVEVYCEVGFKNLSHFSYAFKKQFVYTLKELCRGLF